MKLSTPTAHTWFFIAGIVLLSAGTLYSTLYPQPVDDFGEFEPYLMSDISTSDDTPDTAYERLEPEEAPEPPTFARLDGEKLSGTYSNTSLGYSVSYPDGWTVDILNNLTKLVSPQDAETAAEVRRTREGYEDYIPQGTMSIQVYNSAQEIADEVVEGLTVTSVEDFLSQYFTENNLLSNAERITVAGKPAWSMRWEGFDSIHTIYIEHSGKIYSLYGSYLYEEIVASFTFL